MKRSELKELVKQVISEQKFKDAPKDKKVKPEPTISKNDIGQEKAVREFLSSRKNYTSHCEQLEDVAKSLKINVKDKTGKKLSDAIIDELNKDKKNVSKVFKALKSKKLITESIDQLIVNKHLRLIKVVLFKMGAVKNPMEVDVKKDISYYVEPEDFTEFCEKLKLTPPMYDDSLSIDEYANLWAEEDEEKNTPESTLKTPEISPEEREVRRFLSTRKDTNNHIEQLLQISHLLGISVKGSDIDDLFKVISDKLDQDPISIEKVFDFLKQTKLIKEIKKISLIDLRNIIKEVISSEMEESTIRKPNKPYPRIAVGHEAHETSTTRSSLEKAKKLNKIYGKPTEIYLQSMPPEEKGPLFLVTATYGDKQHSFEGFSWGYKGEGSLGLKEYLLSVGIPEGIDKIYEFDQKSNYLYTNEDGSWHLERE